MESLPIPALLIDADFSVVAHNTSAGALAAQWEKHPLPQTHPLRAALQRMADEPRDIRLADVSWPFPSGLPDCTVWLAPTEFGTLLLCDAGGVQTAGGQYTAMSSTMAAMMAHEIRNPLLSIRGAAQLLATNVSAEDKALCDLIAAEVARIDQLVANLDPLSPSPANAMALLNIHEVLEQARLAASAAVISTPRTTVDYDPSLPMIRGDATRLSALFLNLLKNAYEALAGREDARITLTTRYALGETRRNTAGVRLPIAVSVADNGPGIPPELVARLFAPFTTSKADGKGLGLAIVASIAEEHGGLILHDSPPTGGTRFTLYLPAAAKDATSLA